MVTRPARSAHIIGSRNWHLWSHLSISVEKWTHLVELRQCYHPLNLIVCEPLCVNSFYPEQHNASVYCLILQLKPICRRVDYLILYKRPETVDIAAPGVTNHDRVSVQGPFYSINIFFDVYIITKTCWKIHSVWIKFLLYFFLCYLLLFHFAHILQRWLTGTWGSGNGTTLMNMGEYE